MATSARKNDDTNTRTLVMSSDESMGGKVTKGAVRYSDGNGHQLYLRKEELRTEGQAAEFPQKIVVAITLNW